MEEIKTDKEHLIELRNKVTGRIIEGKANISYFQEMIKKDRRNLQRLEDYRNKVSINEQNIKQDKVFLRCIDLMLKKGNY